jgi:chorismate-pyruvate lyase
LDFPLEELKSALKDMTIHQVSRKNDSLTFSLEKEAKHLIVSFIDQKKVSAKNQLDILEI